MTLQEQDMCWFGLIMVVDMVLELSLPKNPRKEVEHSAASKSKTLYCKPSKNKLLSFLLHMPPNICEVRVSSRI
jgi:hypothetical protein